MDAQELAGGDSDTSDEEESLGQTPSTQELDRPPVERHAFFFKHGLGTSLDLRQYRPLPSQIPFLLDIFSENVNCVMRVVHMPNIMKLIRELRGTDMSALSPANEALLFSIYYSAVTSMQDEDVSGTSLVSPSPVES